MSDKLVSTPRTERNFTNYDTIYWALVAYIEDSAGSESEEAQQIDDAWREIHAELAELKTELELRKR